MDKQTQTAVETPYEAFQRICRTANHDPNDYPYWLFQEGYKEAIKAIGADPLGELVRALQDIIDIATDQAEGTYDTITQKAMEALSKIPPEQRGE